MVWLWLGVGLWCAVHLMPSLARNLRTSLIDKYGEKRCKIGFALSIALSVVLIVIGWRSALPTSVYIPPDWGRHVTFLAVFIAFFLFSAAGAGSNIKRIIRHPQLTGLAVWAVGHLIANGDSRSVLLFGALGLWAVLEIILLNRRDDTWVRPNPVPVSQELRPLVGAVIVYGVVLFLHPYFTGVSPLG